MNSSFITSRPGPGNEVTAERKGGHTQGCECDPGLQMMGFQISCSLFAEDKELLCLLSVPNIIQKFGVGALIPSLKAVRLECVPPSAILLWVPLQIPCSLATKLISPPPPLSSYQTR